MVSKESNSDIKLGLNKTKSSTLNFRSIIRKIIPKKTRENTNKGNELEHNEFDAVPDSCKKENNIPNEPGPESTQKPRKVNNVGDSSSSHSNEKHGQSSARSASHDEDEPTSQHGDSDEQGAEDFGSHSEKPQFCGPPPSYSNQTNIVINGGKDIHIGNVFNNVNQMYFSGKGQNPKQSPKIRKTEEIAGLLECKDKLEPAHINLLAGHFGKKWKQVGCCLGLSTGELQCIEEQHQDLQEMAYQMLIKWWQSTGESCTVGRLCKTLWRSNIGAAQEAVKQLSLNIQDIK